MFWRYRKVLRDRAAGIVFDWRRGHGSPRRLVLAAVVSASFWGALLAYVQIREPESAPPVDAQIDLTIVDLDKEENRWLAELIDRETIFHLRWDVSDSAVIESAVEQALSQNSPRKYDPTLREIFLPGPAPGLRTLPDHEAGALPSPYPVESVVFATPPVNWWVEVSPIEGPNGLEPFSFKWGDTQPMSEGEIWTILLAVDWQGRVVVAETSIKVNDPRTAEIINKCRALDFDTLPEQGPLRWWKFEAIVVNRPLPE